MDYVLGPSYYSIYGSGVTVEYLEFLDTYNSSSKTNLLTPKFFILIEQDF